LSRSLHRSVAFNWLGLGIRIAVSLWLLPYIVHKLGVATYGEYIFLGAIFGYGELLDFGLRASILRYVGNLAARRDFALLNSILGSIFRYYGLVALGILGVGGAIYFFLPGSWSPSGASAEFSRYAAMFAAVAAASFFRTGWNSVLQACERYDLVNLVETGTFLIRALLIVYLLERGFGIAVVILADLTNVILSAICSRILVARIEPGIRADLRPREQEHLREVIGYSFWAFVNSISSQVRFRSPSLVLGGVLTTTATGYYGVAARVQSYVYQLGTSMNAPFRSRATSIAGVRDADALEAVLFRGTRLLAFFAFSLTSTLAIFSNELLGVWMGPDFVHVSVVLRVLLVAAAVEITGLMLGGALFAVGRIRMYSVLNFAEAILILVSVSILAGLYGLNVAVLGIAAPVFLNKGVLQPVLLLRRFGLSWTDWLSRGLVRPFAALLLALGPIFLLARILPEPDRLYEVALMMALAVLVHGTVGWIIVLDRDERGRAAQTVQRLLGGSEAR
jgi:O-antigen/teichoic acid export membrane protein